VNTIVKRFEFCYGHRLMNYQGKCAHPHGHNGCLEIELSSEVLDERGMVVDFVELKERLEDFIETQLDHRMLLQEGDPLVEALRSVGEEPFVMRANPTAENIARLVFEEARARGLEVAAVRLSETPQSFAEYRG
jgi:6-pyruvoyltetrahydropterin/6-carboxytetrahydropterin synthase